MNADLFHERTGFVATHFIAQWFLFVDYAPEWRGGCARWPVSRVLSTHGLCAGWSFICDARYRTPGATDPDGGPEKCLPPVAAAVPTWSCSRWGLPCRPCYQGRGALLPHPFTLAAAKAAAVCFLWHCPWGRPRRTLSGTVFPWSPDFPPPAIIKGGKGRPSGHLANRTIERSGPGSSRNSQFGVPWRGT